MAMNAVDRGISILKALPEGKAKAATLFLELLAASDEEILATLEIIGDAEFLSSVKEAEAARKSGRLEEFVQWRTDGRSV